MNILIADDHTLTLLGTKSFVESLGYRVGSVCSNGITAYNEICSKNFTIALLDINMPGMDGLEILEKVYTSKIRTKIILLTMHREISIYKRANELGVFGYLLKNHSEEELDICLQSVVNNVQYISPHITKELVMDKKETGDNDLSKLTFTENKILEMIGKQHSTKQIAALLFISEKTVEGHRRNIIDKLGLPKEKNILLQWAIKNMPVK
ncbi:MAG: response regulator transcription factor [Bacteroidetes bacterium]|nr:response regulator transcription factor [Bacteroidota bacterium]